MIKIAIYGKGGIGKSTTTSNRIASLNNKSRLTPDRSFDLANCSHGTITLNGRVVIDQERIYAEIDLIIFKNGFPESVVSNRYL